ncbi:MAG: Rossmann-like and DUF2520 domain-containing protein [Bacteroidota bacterium]
MSIQRIVLIGTGKVAQHLGTQLVAQGRTIAQVYGRRRAASEALAHSLGATATQDWQQLYPDADLYLLAISDRALPHVLEAWPDAIRQRALIAHTSGATPATVLAPYCARYGVFYPLQSFSPDRPANFHQIPICVFAQSAADQSALVELARDWGGGVHLLDDAQRAALHVAAVFVNNFSNHLFQIGADICTTEQLPFALLLPLIQETAAKVRQHPPRAMQTGPALREDLPTLLRHLDYLQSQPQWASLYRQLSKSIQPNLPL